MADMTNDLYPLGALFSFQLLRELTAEVAASVSILAGLTFKDCERLSGYQLAVSQVHWRHARLVGFPLADGPPTSCTLDYLQHDSSWGSLNIDRWAPAVLEMSLQGVLSDFISTFVPWPF